jgi:hypothetical protein
MKRILIGLGAVALASLTAACGYSDRTNYAVAAPGATYYGDRYYDGYAYRTYPSTAYNQSGYQNSSTGYYYSRGDYYRNYRGAYASPPERTM